jgi:hypothetical protein
MPVTIAFQGLCGLVSETSNVATSGSLDVLLVDTSQTWLDCPHEQKLDLPASNLEDPDNLLEVAAPGAPRRTLVLTGKQLKFLPGGVASRQSGFGTANVDRIPEMRQVCGIGTVDSGCFSNPPTKPVAARVELPSGGTLSGDTNFSTTSEWSFVPPISTCYHGIFVTQSHFDLPAADHVVIEVSTLEGQPLGNLTLRSTDASLTLSNICTRTPADTPSDDTLVYYELLDPPFADGDRPVARNSPICEIPPFHTGGLGCVPFLMSRS